MCDCGSKKVLIEVKITNFPVRKGANVYMLEAGVQHTWSHVSFPPSQTVRTHLYPLPVLHLSCFLVDLHCHSGHGLQGTLNRDQVFTNKRPYKTAMVLITALKML